MSAGIHCPLCGEVHENIQQHLQESHTIEEMQQAFQPQVQVMPQMVRASNFIKHYTVEVYIEQTPVDFRLYAINEAQQQQVSPGRIVESRIQEAAFILPPFAAKKLQQDLSKVIKDYENQYGEINLPN